MKQGSTLFLKVVLSLIAAVAFIVMLWFPQTEGRATNLDLVSIYKDPFIIYIYIATVPFFLALHQAFKLLGFIEQNKAFSQISVNALRNIKHCALAITGFLIIAILIIMTMGEEDRAGAIALGTITTFAAIVIATASAVFERLLQNAVDIKSENDLTV